MKTFIIHAHWNNRGDEAAIKAMIDQLLIEGIDVSIQILSNDVQQLNYSDKVYLIPVYPRFRNIPEMILGIISHGKIVWSDAGKAFFQELNKCHIIIHAPGGPSIGDIYLFPEILYLLRFLAAIRFKKVIFVYAPSMGPFHHSMRNRIRKFILKRVNCITLREDISKHFLDELLPENQAVTTLDSAFQNEIDNKRNEQILEKYAELKNFIENDEKIIGMTITDLQWHPVYGKDKTIAMKIDNEMRIVIEKITARGFKILFIPQLFGEQNDMQYMCKFMNQDCLVMSDQYDAYFQQYIIGRMYALIGMRYHSNIFSAKMCVPFISISYEQKMKGFANKIGYEDYCVDISKLNANVVLDRFDHLQENYNSIKSKLNLICPQLKNEAYLTTRILKECMKNLEIQKNNFVKENIVK